MQHSDRLAQLHRCCLYLHAHTPYRVVGIPRSREDFEELFTTTRADLIASRACSDSPGRGRWAQNCGRVACPSFYCSTTTVQGVSPVLLRRLIRPAEVTELNTRIG